MSNLFTMTELAFGFVKQFADVTGNPFKLQIWGETPYWQRNMITGMADYCMNTGAKAPQMHDHWYNNLIQEGWTHGDKYDPVKKESPIILSWGDLPDQIKLYEIFFATIINGLTQILNPKGSAGSLWEIVKISDLVVRAWDAFNMERSETYFTRLWEKTNGDVNWMRDFCINTVNNDISRVYGIPLK